MPKKTERSIQPFKNSKQGEKKGRLVNFFGVMFKKQPEVAATSEEINTPQPNEVQPEGDGAAAEATPSQPPTEFDPQPVSVFSVIFKGFLL